MRVLGLVVIVLFRFAGQLVVCLWCYGNKTLTAIMQCFGLLVMTVLLTTLMGPES